MSNPEEDEQKDDKGKVNVSLVTMGTDLLIKAIPGEGGEEELQSAAENLVIGLEKRGVIPDKWLDTDD
mgnify:CR=1 FL=1